MTDPRNNLATVAPVSSQALKALLARPDVAGALAWIDATTEQFVEHLVTLSQIPAPTFAEGRRAEFVADRLRALDLADTRIDGAGNVLACLGDAATSSGPAFVAHLDTVFPIETDVRVQRRNGRLYGPGIGDNGAGVAGLLLMLEALRRHKLTLERPLWVVASTGEEGLGDLCGVRAAMDGLGERTTCVIAIEGALLGRVTHQAVGSLRWNVSFAGPGGHSWHDFGRPSAINAAARAIASLTRLAIPSNPRTTFNVGRVAGGIGVNVIASEASFLLDMRSTDAGALDDLAERTKRLIGEAAEGEGVAFQIETVGQRPAGAIPRNSPLVQTASRILRQLGLEPRYESASTDANIPLSRGVPAITVGITHGGGVHTEDEWIDIAPCAAGVRQLLLLALALCGTKT